MLKINKHTEDPTAAENEEGTDVVGRFRAGFQVDGEAQSLERFRVTTGEAKLAKAIANPRTGLGLNRDMPKAEAGPQEWDASGEDYLEVFTDADEVPVILESKEAYRSILVCRDEDDEFMYATDGEVITAVGEAYEDDFEVGEPDPQEGQTLRSRKAKARRNKGSKPDIRIRFRLEAHPEWGVFEYRTGGWSLVDNSPEPKLEKLGDGPIRAVLKLVPVKSKRFSYVKPELAVQGLVSDEKAKAKPKVTGDEDTSPIQ